MCVSVAYITPLWSNDISSYWLLEVSKMYWRLSSVLIGRQDYHLFRFGIWEALITYSCRWDLLRGLRYLHLFKTYQTTNFTTLLRTECWILCICGSKLTLRQDSQKISKERYITLYVYNITPRMFLLASWLRLIFFLQRRDSHLLASEGYLMNAKRANLQSPLISLINRTHFTIIF